MSKCQRKGPKQKKTVVDTKEGKCSEQVLGQLFSKAYN